MSIVTEQYATAWLEYTNGASIEPLLIHGNALEVLKQLPNNAVDFCMTSPPYWGQRQYNHGGLGLEETPAQYLESLLEIFSEVKRILKPTGSFWLNMGDTYHEKGLVGLPWRIALRLVDEQNWVLRNDIIWHKVKGGLDTSKDRLRNVHEYLFHLVKDSGRYYYDVDAIRTKPRQAKVSNGAIVSATGVTGVRYKRQIELSAVLSATEKQSALEALNDMLHQVEMGQLSDFRMIIRGQQRTTHSDMVSVSGRARELQAQGFYFLKYHPKGSKPSDVWEILPEDTQKRNLHYAPYPEDLCKIPLLATCPPDGIVLDPFCGTGTTNLVARLLGRKSVGIDISADYLALAEQRCRRLL